MDSLRRVGWARGAAGLTLCAVAFAAMTVLPAGIRPTAVSLVPILFGLGMLIWLLSGHELMRSRSDLGGVVIELSPLLVRVSSAMMALMFIALGFEVAPASPVVGPAFAVVAVAAATSVLSLVIGAVPQTHTWGRRNP